MKNYNGKCHLLVVGMLVTILSAGISFGQLQASLGTGVQANFPQNQNVTQPQATPADNGQQNQVPYQLGAPMQLPGHAPGTLVIPVTVPEVMTYNPPPVNMVVQRPAQLVIPPYPPMQMQSMPQQMPQQMMMPQQPQQPIPVKMIMPDGSVVSIKHYIPGKFWRNLWRAVTP